MMCGWCHSDGVMCWGGAHVVVGQWQATRSLYCVFVMKTADAEGYTTQLCF